MKCDTFLEKKRWTQNLKVPQQYPIKGYLLHTILQFVYPEIWPPYLHLGRPTNNPETKYGGEYHWSKSWKSSHLENEKTVSRYVVL